MAHMSLDVPFSALDIGRHSHNENMQNSFGGSSLSTSTQEELYHIVVALDAGLF